MSIRKNERGQVFGITALSLVLLLAVAAFVLDVGSWYRSQRRLQGTADAAALAGAQALPDSTGARGQALNYANQNGGDVAAGDVTVSTTYVPNDTISVRAARSDTGLFSGVIGIGSANISARARARVDTPQQARYVAPIVVKNTHPLIQGRAGCPCFDEETTLDLSKAGAPGAFDLINLDGSRGGTSPDTLADWMLHGYDGYLGLGDYYSDTGAKFNGSQMQGALEARKNTTLLFPVYDVLSDTGANAHYHVIGWIGFHMTDWSARGGNNGTLTGYFTEFIATGILNQSGASGLPNFGVRSVQLID